MSEDKSKFETGNRDMKVWLVAKREKERICFGCGGGLVISALDFYSDDLSSILSDY